MIEKLDLIEKNGKGEIVQKKNYEQWFNNKEKLSLDYKVKINAKGNFGSDYIEQPKKRDNKFIQKTNQDGTQSTETSPYPLFFGNMGKDYYEEETIKKFEFCNGIIELTIHSVNSMILDEIKKVFPEFLLVENFGTRQGKGFGSFYIDKSDKSYIHPNERFFDYKFEVEIDDNEMWNGFKNIFNRVDLFYRALRSGINQKEPEYVNSKRQIKKDKNGINEFKDVFYFKSMLFLYFKEKKIQWEKKTIKEKFFSKDGSKILDKGKPTEKRIITYYGLTTQKTRRASSDLLTYSSNDIKLVKDLLGLSTEESWISYKNSIKKVEAKDDGHGSKIKKETKEDQIQRFNSPILFKILETDEDKKYSVYIKLSKDIPVLGKWFIIEDKYGNNFHIQFPHKFDLNEFFDFMLNKSKFNISNHVDKKFWQHESYITLFQIFKSLEKIIK